MLVFSNRLSKKGIHLLATLVALVVALPCLGEDILVVRPDEMNFKNALDGLADEIDLEYSIFDLIIDKDTTVDEFAATFQEKKPSLVVLMEGKSLKLYEQWQQKQPEGFAFPPALVFMTVYAEERIRSLKNAVGIKYEIQAVHSVSSLRSVLEQPVNRVGVLYSSNLRVFFANQKAQCQNEKIELVGVMINEGQRALEKIIQRELKTMLKDDSIDAIWILPDNVILKDVLLEWAWKPRLKKAKKPVVVSIERFLSELKLGHFAVVPDHYEMGTQAARWIYQIGDDGWKLNDDEPKVRRPYSAHKKLDSKRVPKNVRLNQTVVEEEWTDYSASPQ